MNEYIKKILLVTFDRRPPTIDEGFLKLKLHNAIWKFDLAIKRENSFSNERRSFDEYFRSTKRRFHQRSFSLKDSHTAILNWADQIRIRRNVECLVIVTRRKLPGDWMSISDYQRVAVISVNSWDRLYYPPRVEFYLAKELITYALLFSGDAGEKSPFHESTRGCLFDQCNHKPELRAGLWGYICKECKQKLRNWGIHNTLQEVALKMLHIPLIPHQNVAEKPAFFICHDSRDKEKVVRPIAETLMERGVPIWFDENSLKVGDNLRDEIEAGLKSATKCVVVISEKFIGNKGWPKVEFDSIFTREILEKKNIVLPVWHEVEFAQVYRYSPQLANKVSVNTKIGISEVAEKLLQAVLNAH